MTSSGSGKNCVPRLPIRPVKMDIDHLTNDTITNKPSTSPSSPTKRTKLSTTTATTTTTTANSSSSSSTSPNITSPIFSQPHQRSFHTAGPISTPSTCSSVMTISAATTFEPPSTPPSKRSSLHLRPSTSSTFFSPEKRPITLSPEKKYFSPQSYPHQQQYHLPNSPAVKRTSTGLHKLNYPSTPDRRSLALANSQFELASPGQATSSPMYTTDEILKSSEKLQEISSNLKTRLSYAFLKVQNGWQDKSLDQLENNQADDHLENPDSDRPHKKRTTALVRNKHKSLPTSFFQQGNFLNQLTETPASPSSKNHSSSLMEPFNTTPKSNRNSSYNNSRIMLKSSSNSGGPCYNFEEEDNILSANDAFLAAISRSSPQSQTIVKPRLHVVSSSRSLMTDGLLSNSTPSPSRPLAADDKHKEQEAIQSLLSLSSPISNNKTTLSAPSSSKKQPPWDNDPSKDHQYKISPTPKKHATTIPRFRDGNETASPESSRRGSSSTEEEEGTDPENVEMTEVKKEVTCDLRASPSEDSASISQIKGNGEPTSTTA
ncbi:hypothetical protein DASC09_040130 [Saccharomycopsis crataegensis]|uniref:Uncharacterized protein n=1 Tax=Saccharomycopsis crataegensis TaxID=43959 RepID=A0AAV5QRD2_9ASCO|nr:hypothetical protein DASC09_040130 [Saccharomycopsis crataegensis]